MKLDNLSELYKNFPELNFLVITSDGIEVYQKWDETAESIQSNDGCAVFALTPLDPRSYVSALNNEELVNELAWKGKKAKVQFHRSSEITQ